MKYIKSPLNYTGGKYKLLPQIIPLFPNKIGTFVDLFGGGFNVGVNIKADKIIYNDSVPQLVDLLQNFSQHSFEEVHEIILNNIKEYGLSKSDNLGIYDNKYFKLRDDYNSSPSWDLFYTLITCSFSNQIRFNSKGGFNMPYGKRDYNKSLEDKLKIFVTTLNDMNVQFVCNDFTKLKIDKLTSSDFVYCDPPYFNSTATYNEQNGWTEQNEESLLKLLDNLNDKKIKFALSNNLKYNNPSLDKWKDKYNVHYLNGDYNNCNYQKKDKSKDIEVLITNY